MKPRNLATRDASRLVVWQPEARRTGLHGFGARSTKVFVDNYEHFRIIHEVCHGHLPRPTDAELEILRALWELGPATVRQVHEALSAYAGTGYTTTLKLMQIMADKGLVTRNESARTHVYDARVSQEHTQRQLVNDLVERAFGGSAAELVLQSAQLASGIGIRVARDPQTDR